MTLCAGLIIVLSTSEESITQHLSGFIRSSAKGESPGVLEMLALYKHVPNSANQPRDLLTIQAINTVTEASSSDLKSESYLRAKRFLQDERLMLVKLRLSPSDLETYWKYVNKGTSDIPQESRAAVERVQEWMENKF